MTQEENIPIVNIGENGISNFTSSFVFNGILNVKEMYYLVNFFLSIYFLFW